MQKQMITFRPNEADQKVLAEIHKHLSASNPWTTRADVIRFAFEVALKVIRGRNAV